jgi:hypothetical protein
MPMRITVSGDIKELKPTSGWTSIKVDSASHEIKTYPGYYVAVLNIMGK